MIQDFDGFEFRLPIDEWFEIKHEIDLTDEMGEDGGQKCYINGELFYEEEWNCAVGDCGDRAIGSLDLYAAQQPDVFYDDISLTSGGEGEETGCLYKLKKKPKARGGCKTCPKKGDLIANGEDCDPEKKLKKECAKKFKPRGKQIPCPDGENGTCKKIVGKRDSCAG